MKYKRSAQFRCNFGITSFFFDNVGAALATVADGENKKIVITSSASLSHILLQNNILELSTLYCIMKKCYKLNIYQTTEGTAAQLRRTGVALLGEVDLSDFSANIGDRR